jgi:hypothetical protein
MLRERNYDNNKGILEAHKIASKIACILYASVKLLIKILTTYINKKLALNNLCQLADRRPLTSVVGGWENFKRL